VDRIGYFGPQGTFTEQAALALTRPDDERVPLPTVPDALDAVRDGGVAAACVPVENSVDGGVAATMDALAEGPPLLAVAETVLPIRFSVLTRPRTGAEQVRTVASHPVALAQVRNWLACHLPGAEVRTASSTAAAAVGVTNGEFDAAVAAPVAERHYPLASLASGVADVAGARTRFLLVRGPGAPPAATGADRSSLILHTPDTPGALAAVLTELAQRGINLTRIESRPTRAALGEYRFHLDFDGHIAEERVADALAALYRRGATLRFLGSFPRADGAGRARPAGSAEGDFAAARAWVAAARGGRGEQR
jgi:prephenate dehydratase